MLALLIRVSAGPWPRKARSVNRRIRTAGHRARGVGRPAVRPGLLRPGVRGRRDRRPSGERPAPDHRRVQGGARTDHHRRPEHGASAQSVQNEDERRAPVRARSTPTGPLFAGHHRVLLAVYGRTELEQAMNTYLSGDAPELAVSTLADLVLGRPKKGGARHHDGRREPAGGRGRTRSATSPARSWRWIPAPATSWRWSSNPTFDPNELSSQDSRRDRRGVGAR